jgi:hypothetical protein
MGREIGEFIGSPTFRQAKHEQFVYEQEKKKEQEDLMKTFVNAVVRIADGIDTLNGNMERLIGRT